MVTTPTTQASPLCSPALFRPVLVTLALFHLTPLVLHHYLKKGRMIGERANVWWASLLCTRFEDGAIEVAWDGFVRLFRAKFVPENIQDRMKQEFLSLTQGSLTVLEYEARFAELSKYAPHIVTDDRMKAKKFMMGMKSSLRMRLVAFDHRTLDKALSAACRQEGEMEQYLEEKKASQKRPAATFQRQDKKKAVYQAPQRPATTSSAQVPSQRSLGVKKECPHCGKTHGGTECWMIAGKCLKCGSSDHKIKDFRHVLGAEDLRPWPATPSPFPLSSPPLVVLCLPLSPICVSDKDEGHACCRGVVDLARSEEEVANRLCGRPRDGASRRSASLLVSRPRGVSRHEKRRQPDRARPYRDAVACRCRDAFSCRDRVAVATRCPDAIGWLSRCSSPSQWYRNGLGGHDSACVCLGCFVVPVGVSACASGLACPRDLQVGNACSEVLACSCMPWLADDPFEGLWVPLTCWACRGLQASGLAWFLLCLPDLFARCLALEGLSHSEVVSVAWDPHPQEPSREAWDTKDGRSSIRCRLASPLSHCLTLRCFWSRVGRREPASERRGCGRRVLLLAASGGGLVAVIVTSSVGVVGLALGKPVLLVVSARCSPGSVVSFLGASLWWHRCVRLPDLWCVRGPEWFCLSALDPVEVCSFPASFMCALQCVACMASVVARCVRAVVVRLALDSLAVVFPMWRTVAGKSSVQTWTPTLILASSDMDANLSGLYAQQSCKLLKQESQPLGGVPNGSEGCQAYIDGKVPGRRYYAWRPSTMPLTLSQRPETAAKFL
ncbi:hypothetical protein Taro_030780 [Colocasia esculenta]|uniref:Retrotransposon gag domain-containing protein n=1 Tax=Colocasia esculenta TaxID=4460 RepID=A0A843VN99_COLES|nr:hypothetical protein [Colocasia esculenta]